MVKNQIWIQGHLPNHIICAVAQALNLDGPHAWFNKF